MSSPRASQNIRQSFMSIKSITEKQKRLSNANNGCTTVAAEPSAVVDTDYLGAENDSETPQSLFNDMLTLRED